MAGEMVTQTVAHAELNWSIIFGFIISGLIMMLMYMIQRGIAKNDEEKAALKLKVDEDKKAADLQREQDRKDAEAQREADKIAAAQARKEISDSVALDRKLFDEKLEKMGTLFAMQLTTAATTFGGQVEKTSENFMREVRDMKLALDLMAKEMNKLANTMIQIERDSTIRYEALSKRFEDSSKETHAALEMHWKEIKEIREWKHETDTLITRLVATTGVGDIKRDNWEKETAVIREQVLNRIAALEKINEDMKGYESTRKRARR